MIRHVQYQVWMVGGGYFQSFQKYGEASEFRDKLQKESPNNRFIIIEDEWYD